MSNPYYKLRKTQILGDLKVSEGGSVVFENIPVDESVDPPSFGEYKLVMQNNNLFLMDSNGTTISLVTGEAGGTVDFKKIAIKYALVLG